MTLPFEDDELAYALAEALRTTHRLAPGIADRGRRAFTWRTVDEDLLIAELMFDSDHTTQPSTSRGPDGGSRVLVFAAELRSVEVEVLSDRVLGQFVPPAAGEVQIEADSGVVGTVAVDDLGFFVIEPVPDGLVRLRCASAHTRLITDWVRL